MISSNGYSQKTTLFFKLGSLAVACLFLLVLINPSRSHAVEATSSGRLTYSVDESGKLVGRGQITLRNNGSTSLLVKYYTFTLPFGNLSTHNVLFNRRNIDNTVREKDGGSSVTIDLNNTSIPVGGEAQIIITFTQENFLAVRKYDSIELPFTFPDTKTDSVEITLDKVFGDVAVVNNSTASLSENTEAYSIRISAPRQSSGKVILLQNVTHQFEIKKSFDNTDTIEKGFDLTLPATRHNQLVTYTSISKTPETSFTDQEWNVFLRYILQPGEKIDLNIRGEQSFMSNSADLAGTKSEYTRGESFWAIDDQSTVDRFEVYLKQRGVEIVSGSSIESLPIAQRQKFYESLYLYILLNLELDEQVVGGGLKNSARLGAQESLKVKRNLTTIDYSDSAIALLRHYGVPSQMIFGYIANNSEIYQGQFIHNWVEFWDVEMGWIGMDPALAEISGLNMYNFKDLDHISIVARHENPIYPHMTYFSPEEISFTRINESIQPRSSMSIQTKLPPQSIFSKRIDGVIEITNTGNTVISDVTVSAEDSTLDINETYKTFIYPGMTGRIQIDGERSEYSALESVDLIVESIDSREIPTSEKISAAIDHVEYWWWRPFLLAINSLLFLLTLYFSIIVVKWFERNKPTSNISRWIKRWKY